jgi:hypothetical protein
LPQVFSHRQRRKYMPAGTAGHDQNRFLNHLGHRRFTAFLRGAGAASLC